MRARVNCAHPSIRNHWALMCVGRCPDQVVNLMRDPQCLSPQASLVLIYRSIAGSEAKSTFPSPGIGTGPVVWKRDTLPLDHWAFKYMI
ncbi:hypothetical protein TNCV_1664701 [Trichonephila clavipes]|uniref:Uncharacterized protein n=1 Tax=Trichonephila clavipes TaxID=2585209 RepID=A0A8X6RTR0_TRICX|nr:hypothetical protein TNCV_1664701 [Trichonephila clavipes]